jgi:hypothetical protein
MLKKDEEGKGGPGREVPMDGRKTGHEKRGRGEGGKVGM